MAQLDVRPKKNPSWWIWVLITIFALAVLFYFVRSCGQDASNPNLSGGDSAVVRNASSITSGNWSEVPFNSPQIKFEEVVDEDINIRGNDDFAIYSINETILFDADAVDIKQEAEGKLSQITQSINQRFRNGKIRIYGYTDAQGSKTYNRELAQQRAESVRNWIINKGKIQEKQISLNPVGESNPVAANTTADGRQQNRRVEIVATH